MIFNEELDKSLCLMLESDKKNKEHIECFINSIPSEVYQQIYDKLREYEEYECGKLDIFELDNLCLYGECNYYEGRFKYSFVIDMVDNSLKITKNMLISGEYKDYAELTLCMGSRYNDVNVFGRQYIGSYTNYVTKNKTEYNLISTLIGLMVEYSCYDYKKMSEGFKKYKRVNLDLILMELNLSNDRGLSRVRKVN